VRTAEAAKSGLAATPTPGQVALGVGTGVCLLGCLALLLHDWLAHAATLLPATLQITRDTAS
jgi:hypothetical protein